MNFKLKSFLFLLVSLMVGVFFLILGMIFLILPWYDYTREAAAQFFIDYQRVMIIFGIGMIFIGIGIFSYVLHASKKSHLSISTGQRAVTIDHELIEQYLNTYWRKHFPKRQIPFHFHVKKKSLHIDVELPNIPVCDRMLFLNNVKEDLGQIFSDVIGYRHPVHLIASFQKEKK